MSESTFCLLPPGVAVDRLLPAGDPLVLETHSTNTSAACPLCHQLSSRRHSSYPRRLADLPWQGRTVELHLQVRRFRCANASCPRRVFAERLPAAAPFRKRRTARLAEIQPGLALAVGGEGGSRLAALLAMPVSGDTLLRLIRAVDHWPRRLGLAARPPLRHPHRRPGAQQPSDRSACRPPGRNRGDVAESASWREDRGP